MKMFKNLSKPKKILIYALATVLIISSIWLYLKASESKKASVLPTPIPVKFELLKTIPISGSTSTIPTTSNIEFYFSKPIDEETAIVTVNPYTPLTFRAERISKAFYVRANPLWELNKEYVITIKIKSLDGDILQEDIKYNFKLNQMKDSLLTE
jgi:hypothetical protein